MSRKPDGAQPRTERITVRITPAGLAQLERFLRDGETLGAFVRTAIAAECDRRVIQRATGRVAKASSATRRADPRDT